MGRFCGKAQFPYSFEQIAQNYAQTVSTKFPHQEIRWNCCILHSAIQSVTLFLLKKSNCSHSFFQIYCVFAEEKLRQGDIISTNYHNFLGFFFFNDTFLVLGMHILKEVCYMTTSFPAIHFFNDSVIVSRERLKQFICSRHCIYFTTLVATIHYDQRSVVDSKKFEEYALFRKNIVALLF